MKTHPRREPEVDLHAGEWLTTIFVIGVAAALLATAGPVLLLWLIDLAGRW
jgi:hypothetical protein